MALENCPKCEKVLPPPFASSGRQVCSGCGWVSEKINSEPVIKSSENIKESKDKKKFKLFLNWLASILPERKNTLLIFLLLFWAGYQLLKDKYEYTQKQQEQQEQYEYMIASPSDYTFEESMDVYGSQGWKAVSCRRASDRADRIMYECIMIREKKISLLN